MSMSDLMSRMDLTTYPLVALVIFFGVFVMIFLRLMRVRDSEIRHGAQLPLDDLTTTSTDISPDQSVHAEKSSTTPAHG